jgi:Transposase and inactivated derivatives
MTRLDDQSTSSPLLQELFALVSDHGVDSMAHAFTMIVNAAMLAERDAALGAGPYERSEQRRGYANGFKSKTVTSRAGKIEFRVPKARGIEFYPRALEKGVRSEKALKVAIAEMYVQGVSTRKVREVTERLCGTEISSTQVSRLAQELDEEFDQWRNRSIGAVPYLILDARYEKVRHAGAVVSCAILVAIGICEDGKRSVLGVSCKLSEAEPHWREFLQHLLARGMHGVQMIVSDDHAGLRAAREAVFPSTPWQRCQFHLIRNAFAYVPKQSMRSEVARDIRSILDSPDRAEADRRISIIASKYRTSAPSLSDWIEHSVPEALTVLRIHPDHRRRLRTTNMLEALNKEIKRRTRVATLFPNAASVLRLISAILIEVDEDWTTGRVYLDLTKCQTS